MSYIFPSVTIPGMDDALHIETHDGETLNCSISFQGMMRSCWLPKFNIKRTQDTIRLNIRDLGIGVPSVEIPKTEEFISIMNWK